MDTSDYVTLRTAGALAGVPEWTLRQWIAEGVLPSAAAGGEERVPLADVWRLAALANYTQSEQPESDRVAVTVLTGDRSGRTVIVKKMADDATVFPPGVEPAPAPLPRAQGLALVAALVGAIIARLDGLYSDLLSAKDHQIAAQDELIAELRRRVERAERGMASLNMNREVREDREAAGIDAVPSLDEVVRLRATNARQVQALRLLATRIAALEAARQAEAGSTATPGEPDMLPREGAVAEPPAASVAAPVPFADPASARVPLAGRARTMRRLQAAAVATAGVLLAAGAAGLAHAVLATPATAPARTPAALAAPLAPIGGVPLPVRKVIGGAVGLLDPRAAVALPGGYIAVADTGNRRLALLDGQGRLVRSEQVGHPLDLVALAMAGDALYALDAGRGAIARYDMAGRFERVIVRGPDLRGASGLAASHGRLYVAAPGRHEILVLATDGRMVRRIAGARGLHLGRPVDVALAGDGHILVLDDAIKQVIALSPAGAVIARWPAPPSTSGRPVRLLPLPDGRLLLSDPSGVLLLYSFDSSLPVFRRALRLPGRQPPVAGPLGLSRTSAGNLLIVDTAGNRLLVASTPP